jgi:hypothetical protein
MQSTIQNPTVGLQQSAGRHLYVPPNAAIELSPAEQIMTTYPLTLFDPGIRVCSMQRMKVNKSYEQ